MDAYFELADISGVEDEALPFMRLCLALEKRFPNIRGWQQIQDLCDIATENENCFFTFRDTWLKTTVTLKDPDSLFRGPLSKDALRERILKSPGVDDHHNHFTNVVQRCWNMWLLRRRALTSGRIEDVEPQIAIRRNVLPRQRYWMKLLEFYRRPHLTRDFYTRRVLDRSLREGKSLQEVRREQYSKYALATSLRPATRRRHNKLPAESATGVVDLQAVDPTCIVPVKKVAEGTEGSVWKVVWGNCTYALKSYKPMYPASFAMEHTVATMRPVSQHPHIVQAFGHSRLSLEDDDSTDQPNDCLLMELLDGDLSRVMYEAARTTPLSRLDKLDVLLQIASAMRRLHEHKVVHGDLKPGNVLLGDFEVSGHVRHFLAKVADFGSAKIISDSSSNFVPSWGTTRYSSPEVLMMTRPAVMMALKSKLDDPVKLEKLDVPAKLDVYSFGVMAYEILTESLAFDGGLSGQNLIDVAAGRKRLIDSEEWQTVKRTFGIYDELVVPLVEKCLERDPKKRPTFSKVCWTLRCARSNLQALERRVLKLKCPMINLIVILLFSFIFLFYPWTLGIIVDSLLSIALLNILIRLEVDCSNP